MIICKICGHKSKSLKLGFSMHLRASHNLSALLYFRKYEDFDIPKCLCGKDRKLRNGISFRDTCGNTECKSKNGSLKISKSMTDEVKQVLREKRLKFLKENPKATAWRLRNKQSWPEKFFEEACIRRKLNEKYLIIREYSVFPYFIDFAFENAKVAVEVDGSQHKEINRLEKDNLKNELLLSKGWRIFRCEANKLYSEEDSNKVIEELEFFLQDTSTFKQCRILSHKEHKEFLKLEKLEEKRKKKNELRIRFAELDFVSDYWKIEMSEILKILPCSVPRYFKRVFPDLYKEKLNPM